MKRIKKLLRAITFSEKQKANEGAELIHHFSMVPPISYFTGKHGEVSMERVHLPERGYVSLQMRWAKLTGVPLFATATEKCQRRPRRDTVSLALLSFEHERFCVRCLWKERPDWRTIEGEVLKVSSKRISLVALTAAARKALGY